DAHLKRELEWIRQTPAARRSKSKARIKDYERLLEEHQAAAENSMRGDVELRIPPGPRLPNKVLIVEDVKKSYGDKLLFEHLSFELPAGGIVGITGPNGAGKTTLVKMMMGLEQPDAGRITVGKTVQFCYVDQG